MLLREALDVALANHLWLKGEEEFLSGFVSRWLAEGADHDEEMQRDFISAMVAREIGGPNSRVARIFLLAMALSGRTESIEWLRDTELGGERMEDFNLEIVQNFLADNDDLVNVFNCNTADVLNVSLGTFSYGGETAILDELARLSSNFSKATLVREGPESPAERMHHVSNRNLL